MNTIRDISTTILGLFLGMSLRVGAIYIIGWLINWITPIPLLQAITISAAVLLSTNYFLQQYQIESIYVLALVAFLSPLYIIVSSLIVWAFSALTGLDFWTTTLVTLGAMVVLAENTSSDFASIMQEDLEVDFEPANIIYISDEEIAAAREKSTSQRKQKSRRRSSRRK